MEPAGTPPPPAAPPGVLAAQDAIVFSGTGAEGVTPPAMAPGGTDVFWASLVQAQLCVWELQGAIEGTPDGSDREPSAQGGWHHGDTVGSASTARSVSPKFMTMQGIISQENTPTDGNISPKFIPMEGNISPKFMPMEGNVSPKFMPMDGNISPKFMPMEGNISPKFMPTDGDISHEHYGLVPTDENISPRSMSTGGSISPVSVLMDGTISPKFTPMDEAISQENMPMDRSITPKFMPTDRTVSPKFMPTGGNTSPEHQAPERSKDDDGNGDDDDDGDGDDNDDGDGDDDGDDHDNGCSSREEDAEEDLDLEEEEPQFHTNPLFQSRVLPPMGAQWVPLYRPHCPPLLTEGDNAMEGCPTPPRDPSPLGCHPARGDIGSTTEQDPLPTLLPATAGSPETEGYRGIPGGPPHAGGPQLCLAVGIPGRFLPGGEVAQGPPPSTLPPHPVMEELPPETGEEPPPDPPTSTHGNPPGGSAVTPALANGGQGGQGRRGEAQRLAARLFHLNGFKRSQVAAFLRKNNDFSGMVAQEYLDFFQFEGQTLDQALRSFLQALVLTGETQERERILGHFSRRYHRCNPGAFPSPDAVHSLTCAIMLLNTDLHGQRLGRAMTSSEFVANLSGMMDGQDFPREQLKALYSSIRSEKLAWAADEEEEEEVGGAGSLAPPGCKKSNPSVELAGGPGAVTYRQGWLARKVLAEADGKKTPWGRRGWKPFQAVLKGTVLYFLKPGGRMGVPRRPPEPGPFLTPQEEGGPEAEEPLGVHHALAERASKYTKRPNVFRLQTADWRVFLFQAPTPEEMFSWISRINLVAALFSSPPFPAAVGSQRRFVRPILPAAPSRSAPEEQHRSHEAWMERVAQELFEHQRNLPEKRGRARDLDEYRLKKEYLLYERRRYETYVQVLETWIGAGARDLEGWEAQAGPEVAPPDPPTLTKAHSSPSLVPEPPLVPTIRVKRNISERRTVRKIVPKRNKNLL